MRGRLTGGRRAWLLGAAALVIAGFFAAGLALGSSEAPAVEEAAERREEAAARSEASAFDEAFAAAENRGLERGGASGRRAGEKEGSAAGGRAGAASAAEQLAAETAAEAAETAEAAELPVVCDGAVADDAQYAACLEQSGEPIPPGFPGGPSGCATEPPFPVEGPCADVRR